LSIVHVHLLSSVIVICAVICQWLFCFFFFFFSSRRRHTRSKRDWSSDVCSSDLIELLSSIIESRMLCRVRQRYLLFAVESYFGRSEERRVGKECRSGWGTCHYKKKRRVR